MGNQLLPNPKPHTLDPATTLLSNSGRIAFAAQCQGRVTLVECCISRRGTGGQPALQAMSRWRRWSVAPARTPTREILDFIALAPGHEAMMQFFRAGFNGNKTATLEDVTGQQRGRFEQLRRCLRLPLPSSPKQPQRLGRRRRVGVRRGAGRLTTYRSHRHQSHTPRGQRTTLQSQMI